MGYLGVYICICSRRNDIYFCTMSHSRIKTKNISSRNHYSNVNHQLVEFGVNRVSRFDLKVFLKARDSSDRGCELFLDPSDRCLGSIGTNIGAKS